MKQKQEANGIKTEEIDALFQKSFDLSGKLVFFPVRHHSPACSLHLEKTIALYKPDCILIECPADTGHLIPCIADSLSVPPFAIYCGFDDKEGLAGDADGKYRAYYPFLEYSPEYRAIKRAAELGINVHFIDLPYASRLIQLKAAHTELYTRHKYNEDTEYEINSYTAMLARKTGFRSYAEFWEAFYELKAASLATEEFVRALFHLSYYMRDADADQRDAEINEDRRENELREYYMASRIALVLKEYSRVLVICGAYHTLGIVANLEHPPPAPIEEKDAPQAAAYLMPYTFAEMDGRKGYAAGMPFPAYYQEIWTSLDGRRRHTADSNTNAFAAAARHFIVKTARFVRKTNPVSIPDETNALAMAFALANLRGKAAPGVYELIDGVQSAFVKGDINRTVTAELDYLFRALSGLGAGKVAVQDQIPPIVLDFRERCKEYRIKTDTTLTQESTLDILKTRSHYRKSRFFHQMRYLETGFCRRISGPDYVSGASKNLVREIWEFRFSSKVETMLIDQSVFGATIAEASAAIAGGQFRDSIGAGELGKLLISAEVMGLEGFYENYQKEIDVVLNREGSFTGAVSCLGSLRYLKKLQILLRGEDDPWVGPLLIRAYSRGVELMEDGRKAGPDDECGACEALRSLFNITVESVSLSGLSGEETALFGDKVETIVNEGFCNSRFYGSLLAIYEKQGRIDSGELGARVSARLESSVDNPEDAASFIAGVFLIGRDILFGGFEILEALDKVVSAMGDEDFLMALPNFRHAFTSFLPSETDRIGGMVARLYGLPGESVQVSEQVSREELVLGMALDKKAAGAFAKWGLGLLGADV